MSNQQLKSKAISLSLLFKVDVANPNAGWTEGTVTVLKKVERPDGKAHPYISGQALRRYLRDTLADLPEVDKEKEISPLETTGDPKAPIVTKGVPKEFMDDDLFGFMRAIGGRTRRRESPLRVAPAFGLFPYTGDRDLGTRSAVEATGEAEAGGSMFETEITNNIFRCTVLLELDRVGRWKAYETTLINKDELPKGLERRLLSSEKKKEEKERVAYYEIQGPEGERFLRATDIKDLVFSIDDNDVRKRRVELLLKAIKYLWGGGRRTRLLIDLTPQLVVYARLTKKVPIFLNTLTVEFSNGEYEVKIPPLKEVLDDYKVDLQKVILGVREGFIREPNKEKLQGLLKQGETILSVGSAIDQMVQDIKSTDF